MTRGLDSIGGSTRRFAGRVSRRLREAQFWRIQAMVLAITAIHLLVEAGVVPAPFDQAPQGVQHIPVGLYLIPVIYAGFAYGLEGGVLTGLWSALLASVNIPIWHRSDFEWVTELLLITVVIGVGVATAVPVERERRQRRRAEATAVQLRMLNEIVQASVRPWGPAQAANSALPRLTQVLGVRGACLGLWTRADREQVVIAVHAADPSLTARLAARVAETPDPERRPPIDDGVLHVALATERLVGGLCVGLDAGRDLTAAQRDFLQAVGSQLAVGIENAMLRQLERDLLESYVRLITQAQEEERKHIARELHDSVAQQLAALRRGIDEITHGDGADSDLARLRELAGAILNELRRFARDLRPTLLDDLGLVPALRWLVTDVADRTGGEAALDVSGTQRRVAPEVEVALFRITQEALRNVERHATATRVGVEVRFEPERVAISVRDDGAGFEVPDGPGALVSAGKLGLMGMQERAQLAGGSLTLDSSPGGGTVVTVSVPT